MCLKPPHIESCKHHKIPGKIALSVGTGRKEPKPWRKRIKILCNLKMSGLISLTNTQEMQCRRVVRCRLPEPRDEETQPGRRSQNAAASGQGARSPPAGRISRKGCLYTPQGPGILQPGFLAVRGHVKNGEKRSMCANVCRLSHVLLKQPMGRMSGKGKVFSITN